MWACRNGSVFPRISMLTLRNAGSNCPQAISTASASTSTLFKNADRSVRGRSERRSIPVLSVISTEYPGSHWTSPMTANPPLRCAITVGFSPLIADPTRSIFQDSIVGLSWGRTSEAARIERAVPIRYCRADTLSNATLYRHPSPQGLTGRRPVDRVRLFLMGIRHLDTLPTNRSSLACRTFPCGT
jgi:hypothetical protein